QLMHKIKEQMSVRCISPMYSSSAARCTVDIVVPLQILTSSSPSHHHIFGVATPFGDINETDKGIGTRFIFTLDSLFVHLVRFLRSKEQRMVPKLNVIKPPHHSPTFSCFRNGLPVVTLMTMTTMNERFFLLFPLSFSP